ncbi:MAG: hypothetical protein AB7I33_04795 [Gemmatimonadales bacterium]
MAAETGPWRDHRFWLELFVVANLGGLAPDIFLAHSMNRFRDGMEFIPLALSLASPLVLVPGLIAFHRGAFRAWRRWGLLVGWTAVIVGVAGLLLHLESQFFQERTLASLVYAAPFAAPLAYTGLGLLLIMNRMLAPTTPEWAGWVVLLALGGFVGNFVFSLTDHAQNDFFYRTEWIPVMAAALAVGTLSVLLFRPVGTGYLRFCVGVLALQAVVGVIGFGLHLAADLARGPGSVFDRVVYGAPAFAPLLFPDLAALAGIGLWAFARRLQPARADAPSRSPDSPLRTASGHHAL